MELLLCVESLFEERHWIESQSNHSVKTILSSCPMWFYLRAECWREWSEIGEFCAFHPFSFIFPYVQKNKIQKGRKLHYTGRNYFKLVRKNVTAMLVHKAFIWIEVSWGWELCSAPGLLKPEMLKKMVVPLKWKGSNIKKCAFISVQLQKERGVCQALLTRCCGLLLFEHHFDAWSKKKLTLVPQLFGEV